jgi:hypothetical protein
MRTTMTNESESITDEYNQASTESYKMTADEINRELDWHDQLVSNFDKRMTRKISNSMDFDGVAT